MLFTWNLTVCTLTSETFRDGFVGQAERQLLQHIALTRSQGAAAIGKA